MTCAMTGQLIVQPVVSLKTGHLFEKQAIHKHLNSFPYCPVTNQPLSHSDLIDVVVQKQEVKVGIEESPMTYLRRLEEQYSILAIQAFHLKKNLKETKVELAHSLYQNEASHRVIAKLIKEKEEIQNQINKIKLSL